MRAILGRIRFLFTMMITVYMQYKCNIRGEYYETYSCKYNKDFSGYVSHIIIPFLSAGRTQTLETDLLALNNKALVRALCHRQRYFHQAVCIATACTGEVRMTLALGAVVSQFIMDRSFFYKGLMD